ncbi:LacI family transcriptional regulator [Aquamicrobium sp. LC103]|nr:LacI family transcriptional regulator [Aquamicrobium sp. LC103]
MQDVAKAAQVSPMTVSNAYRHPHRVQEATRLRILEIALELGYVPNLSAGHLAAGKSRVIGGTIPSVKNSSFYQYISGLQEGVAEHGYKLILMLADTPEQEMEAIETLIGLRVAGIVLIGNEHEPASIDLLSKSHIPLVETWLLDDAIDMAIGYRIDRAMREVCRHLVAKGRRRIGLIGYDSPASRRFNERPPIFREEMALAGLRSDLIYHVEEAHGFGSGPHALEALLAIDPQLDAVICPTDIVAASVIFECGRRSLSVPGQIAVVGWGDYEIATAMNPALTTVKPQPWHMGNGAVAMLVDRHETGRKNGRSVDTGYLLVARDSA